MQCVFAVRETVVIKPSRINIVAQALSYALPRSLNKPLYTPFSIGGLGLGRRQADWRSPLQEKILVAQHLHFTHIVRQVWFRATLHLSNPSSCASTQASALVHGGGTYRLVKRKKESFRNVCMHTRWRCGENLHFPTVHCFDASHSLQREGHIAINLYRCIVGWLVVGLPRS